MKIELHDVTQHQQLFSRLQYAHLPKLKLIKARDQTELSLQNLLDIFSLNTFLFVHEPDNDMFEKMIDKAIEDRLQDLASYKFSENIIEQAKQTASGNLLLRCCL